MVIAKHEQVLWTVTDKLDDSERGNKGYGSTGI
jgi:dUTPase